VLTKEQADAVLAVMNAAFTAGRGANLDPPHGAMTLARQSLGKLGEELAVGELEHRGYAILAQRYRTRYGEIYIVAKDAATTAFIEVKARVTGECGTAAEAVTAQKQRRLAYMATDYIARNGVGQPALPLRRHRDR
jgi:putative endonuclease